MSRKIILKNLLDKGGKPIIVDSPDYLTEEELQKIRAAGIQAGKEFREAYEISGEIRVFKDGEEVRATARSAVERVKQIFEN